MSDLHQENTFLKKENASLRAEIASLRNKLELALSLIEQLSIQKDSQTSSLPPSSDRKKIKRTKSLRKKSSRKTGGQKGHLGSTLKMRDSPDFTKELSPDYCSSCGHDLSLFEHHLIQKRQVFDLPPIQLQCTEYQQFGVTCSCGHLTKGDFPFGVHAPVQYGTGIESLVGYLSVYQYIPYQRITSFFQDVFGFSMSQGTVDNLLERLAQKGLFVYDQIQATLTQSKTTVGADETSCRVNGENYWAWVWQNQDLTYITISDNRGKKTVEEHFPQGFPQATLTSDRWATHLNTAAQQHQICIPHLQRELNYLEALEKHPLTIKLQDLFKKAIKIKNERRVLDTADKEAKQLEQQMNQLLLISIDKEKYPKTATFQKSLIKLRNTIFPFLYQEQVPPDNNASERAIRNIKVKTKISGQFKSGQKRFAILRSIIDSIRKKRQDILSALFSLANSQYA